MRKETKKPLAISVMLALLSAISIIAGKYLSFGVGEVLRFGFENLPIIFAGIAFGPGAGAIVAVCADLIGCLLVGYAINPIVTLGAAAIGAVSGLVYLLLSRLPKDPIPLSAKIILSTLASHLIGSVIIKTFGLSKFYGMPFGILMLWRLLNYAIVGAFEGTIVYILCKNRSISAAIRSLRRKTAAKKKTESEERHTDELR